MCYRLVNYVASGLIGAGSKTQCMYMYVWVCVTLLRAQWNSLNGTQAVSQWIKPYHIIPHYIINLATIYHFIQEVPI